MSERSDADRRAILREHGHEVTNRGRLSPQLRALADDIASSAGPGSPGGSPGTDEGEYDAGVTAADFGGDDGPPPADEDEPAVALPAERKPRVVRASKPAGGGWRGRLSGQAKTGKPGKKKLPRVSTDRLISSMWEGLARLATPVSLPLGRVLAMQAPVAGMLLDDTVKGTVVDRVLQPAARSYDKGRKVLALAGPPLIVAAMQQAQGLPEQQRMVRLALLETMLREALTTWVTVAGDKVEAAAARHAELESTRAEVDAMMAKIFAMPEGMPEPEMAGAAA